jgi:GNAT superfamily N-acetyltransferase
MADVAVRAARDDDLAAVQALFEAFYREEGLADAVDAIARTLPEVLSRADTACFVAEADGQIIGAGAMSTNYGLEVGLYAELEDLYVTPAWRGRGVASSLIDAILKEARARGCADVQVVLTAQAQANTNLVKWYARRGFSATGRTLLEHPLTSKDVT